MFKRSTIDLLKLLGVAALYALLLYIGARHFEGGNIVGYFEPASGLALAALLIGGKRYAWGVLLGAALIHAITDDSLWEAVIVASGDTLQALCGAWLLTRDGKFDLRLQLLRDYLWLILLGGCASITIGALAVNSTLLVSGLLAPANYFHSLIQWWMSDTLGVILIAPLILAWLGIRKDWRTAWMMAEAALILGLVILACQAIFLDWWPDNIGIEAKGYWMFLITTWAAVRLGTRGTVIVLVMTATYALLGAIHGVGYFANDIAQTQLVNYWLYTVILSVVGMALATHFTERKQLEQQLSRRLRHRDVMERISRISLSSASIEELLGRVLDEMLTVFNADRAYFLHPCDPDAPSWSVPMERTRPEWPGAFARGMVIPMAPETAEVFRELLASTKPLSYGPAASRCIPAAGVEQFSIRSMIQMVLRPRVDNPWVMGLHHCAQARAYDEDDLLIFKDIGRRVADALSSMIILKNLRESEENLNRAQAVGQVGSWLFNIVTNRLEWSAETYRMFGIPQQEAVDPDTFDAATHPDDRDFLLKAWGEAMAGAPYGIEHRIVVGGQERWVRERAQIERDSEGRPLAGIGTVQDITERKQAEELLLESEQRFRQLAENIREVFWMTDPVKNKMLYISPAYEQVWGRTVQSLYDSPRDWLEAIHGEDRQRVLQAALTRQAVGLYDEEYRIVRPNGEVRWIHDRAFPVRDSGGAVYRIVGVAEDITERKKAELVLGQYKLVIDTVNDGFWITDAMGNILEANAAYAKMSGYSVDELVNMHISQLEAIERSVEEVGAHIEKVIARGHERFETRHRHKDGHEIDVEVSVTFMSELQQFFVFIHDITERKQAKLAMAESESRFREIFNTVNDAIFIHDAETGRVVDVNHRVCEMYGLTREEALACGPEDMSAGTPPYSSAEAIEKIHLARTDGPQTFGWLARARDGHLFWVEVSLQFALIGGQQRILAVVRDISERKAAEEQIRNLAFYDTLTQLPNRRLLNDRLGQTLAASKRSGHYGALMFLDLDNFKPLNDMYGHGVGDLLLIEVARRISRCVREVDTVARFGGDEFVVILSELDADKAESTAQGGIVAEKIRITLAEPYLFKIQQDGKVETTIEHHCAASIGAVVFNSEASAEDILKWADMAMYQAKYAGRNQVHFYGA